MGNLLMARIVVTTVGSLGDLHPMFPVADALRKRGHSITFAVPPLLQDAVADQGFNSHRDPIPPPPGGPDWNRPVAAIKASVRNSYGPYLDQCIRVISDASEGADAILSTPNQVATAIVGERRAIPWVTLTVFPGLIPSAFTVPEPHWLPALPTMAGRVVNRLTWRVYRFALRNMASDVIDQAVDAQGLRADANLFSPGALSPHLCLVLSSPVYSPRQPDWPAHIKVTGFTPWDRPRSWLEPQELARFLEEGPPPVVVTTSMARNAALFFTLARRALEASGRRGILLTGRASDELLGPAPHTILENGIAAWRYIPLSHLLPRASFVIHHAGIGTTIATIRHGLPAIAIPTNFDHWYNAGRVKALGVGRVVSGDQAVVDGNLKYTHLTVERLVDEMDRVTKEPRYRNRSLELSRAMEGEDGSARACDEIEALLSRVGEQTR
jgi:UDP:flavonoid glycosyltransferase YjiC (YdhE family)